MEKETKKQVPKNQSQQTPCKIVIDNPQIIDYKICPLCGHSNKSTEGICKMCSNYLF